METRRDQFAYFLGYVSGRKERFLKQAMGYFGELGYNKFLPSSAFEICPFNDSQNQIMRSFHIFENSGSDNLCFGLQNLIGEFVFLVSEFEPPCCGDGRSFFRLLKTGQIVLQCDRCGKNYDLNGAPIFRGEGKLMEKSDFINIFGEDSKTEWPYPDKLKEIYLPQNDPKIP